MVVTVSSSVWLSAPLCKVRLSLMRCLGNKVCTWWRDLLILAGKNLQRVKTLGARAIPFYPLATSAGGRFLSPRVAAPAVPGQAHRARSVPEIAAACLPWGALSLPCEFAFVHRSCVRTAQAGEPSCSNAEQMGGEENYALVLVFCDL